MAKMFPKVIDSSVKSNAERKVFRLFQEDPVTKDWIVFHSFGIEKHPTLPYGEIDFLVLAPEHGFFVLEVKGGRIRREQGMWVYTDKEGNEYYKSRGPFEQAKDGIYGVIDYVCSLPEQKNWKNFNFGFGVIFPDIEYNIEDLDADQCQVFDLRSRRSIGQFIIDLSNYQHNKYIQLGMRNNRPNIDDIKDFAYLLRKDFDITVGMNKRIDQEEERIIQLTEQQQMCIDGLSDNPRCIIHGLAGTGKTLLAIKNAKESCNEGKRVALFCYNLLLAEHMRHHFDSYDIKPAYIGSLTEYLEELVFKHKRISKIDFDDQTKFYKTILPSLAIEVLLEKPIKYDKAIIDEAQDLLSKDFIDVIDLLIEGGIKHGSWYFFGDFEMQTIFNPDLNMTSIKEYISKQTNYVNFTLTRNCRNSMNIVTEMNRLIGKDSCTEDVVASKTMVKKVYFDEKHDQVKIVDSILNELISQGVRRDEITILSQYHHPQYFHEELNHWKLKHFSIDHRGVTYATIQKFKGLENEVIILTDIYSYENKELIYVGMSRAKVALYILEKKH